jgi:hypothetical protein
MLNSTEKERLKVRASIGSKDRTDPGYRVANLDYRVKKKIKARLSEVDEINYALCSIPEKTAMSALDDDMVAAIFKLTENMLKILRFSPVVTDDRGSHYVVRFGPEEISKKDQTKEFKVRKEPATPADVARQFLVEDHIRVLQGFIDFNRGAPLAGTLDNPLRPLELGGAHDIVLSEGFNTYEKWGRPGRGPWGGPL